MKAPRLVREGWTRGVAAADRVIMVAGVLLAVGDLSLWPSIHISVLGTTVWSVDAIDAVTTTSSDTSAPGIVDQIHS
jgi:hypothetical protein